MKKFFLRLSVAVVCALSLVGCSASALPEGVDPAQQRKAMLSSFAMVTVFFVFMWLFTLRPEKKRKEQAQEMRNSIEVGDKITTIGGLVGSVVHVTNDTVTFETGEDRVRIEVSKWGISKNDGKGSREGGDSQEILNDKAGN